MHWGEVGEDATWQSVPLHHEASVPTRISCPAGLHHAQRTSPTTPPTHPLTPSHLPLLQVKTVQKGTRLLHTLCAEGKTRRDMALTARVPQLKRTMERFVLGVVAFLRERDPGLVVSWGELKHKDLAGNTLHSSQMYPDQGEDEDDEETVLDEGGGEEGEEVTGESQAEMEYEDAEAEEDEY